jgi:hypothetical protein
MSPSACRLPLPRSLPRAVDLNFVLFTVHLDLGWSEMRVHDVFDSPPDVSLGFREFLQPKILLVNLKLGFCDTEPLPSVNAYVGQFGN